ncbi:sulfite exporter TauE/SafE family protein [Halohasta salina]|uniref:sulfite exporter TauE/SafE family protein n=1 Tax=Halohasta salina TaxID=2961621 RepID=UPI0020A466E8|nr:sulfite exporter TauE/SafE family protein [Halohasta salina]
MVDLVFVLLQTCTPSGTSGALDGATVNLGVFFLIGLFGGAHCLGMCGPLVTTYADRMDGGSTGGRSARGGERSNRLSLRMVRQHGLFNLGRALSYTLIGGLFGLAGSLVAVSVGEVTTLLRELNIVVGFTIGLLIIAAGVNYLLRGQVLSLPGESLFGPITRAVQRRLTARIDASVDGPGILGLGALHGLLPCPLLYPAFLYAFVQASPAGGAVSLAVLGLGTIPALFIYGTLFQSLSTQTRVRLHRVLGVAFILLGYIPLQHALMLMGVDLPHPPIPFYQPL